MKKIYFILSLFLFTPVMVFAAESAEIVERSALHIFYERTFGSIGAIAGIIAMVVMWQVSVRVKEESMRFVLRMFVLVLFFINIGSASFGIHGVGILDGETSRYIERICRLIALLIADVAALKIFLNYSKYNDPEGSAQREK